MSHILEVRCPDCGSQLRIDAETGLVLHHQPTRPRDVNLDRAHEQLRRQQEQRDRRFQESVEAEKRRDDLLARKFDQSLRRVQDNPDEPPPLRDFDLD
ncbi:MAG TPA: hypothetical protein VMV31_00735 [Terriglobales bacterium]|nr:hypothetical protein [Terriglobales bacterium]